MADADRITSVLESRLSEFSRTPPSINAPPLGGHDDYAGIFRVAVDSLVPELRSAPRKAASAMESTLFEGSVWKGPID